MEFPIEIVIGIVWILIAALRKRKRASARLPEVDTHKVGETVSTAAPQQDALVNLLRQFGLEIPQPPTEDPLLVETEMPSDGFDHERHGFGSENPYSEEVFENRPAFAPRATLGTTSYDPHRLRQAPAPAPAPAARPTAADWASRLASPDAVRDAFILGEILEPRSRRPRSAPRSGR